MTLSTFAINGFGRIGRSSFRVYWKKYRDKAKLAVINTSGSMNIDGWTHLLRYDTNYGIFPHQLEFKKIQDTKDATAANPIIGHLIVDGEEIIVTAQRDPAQIQWKQWGVTTVLECTGAFTSQEKASAHLIGGAERVIISAPAKGEGIPTGIISVNKIGSGEKIISNASCTTNCVAPVIKVISDSIGIDKAMLTTIHAYTDDQNVQDNSHRDLRRSRSAAENIIPTSTGAAIATTLVIPELTGNFDGLAIRVPVRVGSLSDMVIVTKRQTSIEEINEVLTKASESDQYRGILAVTTDQIVSSDIVGRSESSIVDLSLTNVIGGNLVKIISWYDNEAGYCHRLIEQVFSS